MERIVLRHLSGSKANQVEEFPLAHVQELTIGRDPSSVVKYDPDRDDLVGRQHAKITQDPADQSQFVIQDMNSRNGTYVNKQRIVGSARIMPGDVVQFGPGGPEFQFDLEPRPANMVRPTRVGDSPAAVPATRTGAAAPPITATPVSIPPMIPSGSADSRVGRATVERMVAQSQSKSRTTTLLVAGGLIFVFAVLAVAGGVWYYLDKKKGEANSNSALANLSGKVNDIGNKTAGMAPAEIASAYSDATVYVQESWTLIKASSGKPLFFKFVQNAYKDKSGQIKPILPVRNPYLAVYRVVPSGDGNVIEPELTDDDNGPVLPVGFPLTGSGFCVTNDGFIITNLHVATPWAVFYHFNADYQFPGILVDQRGSLMTGSDGSPMVVQEANVGQNGLWVPANTKQFGESIMGQPTVQGRPDTFTVTFAKTELRQKVVSYVPSDRHDVALLKVDIPETLPKVELNDNYDTIKPGDNSTVLGYPGSAPQLVGVIGTKGKQGFYAPFQEGIIPNPTLSVGYISRILRPQEGTSGKDTIVSTLGDVYQLTINSTGGGNSGGPVFDNNGKVVGIYTYGIGGDFQASAAVPIRYAKELMGLQKVIK